jgi:hypothetical protein
VSHYEVLGIAPGASAGEVRQAYLDAARRHHPDLESDPARRARSELQMQQVNAAWTVLGDPDRRRRYDQTLGLPGPGEVPRRAWVPLDLDDDDEVDPRDLIDDTPYGDGGHLPRALQVAPPMLVVLAVACILLGAFTAIPGLLALGVAAGVAGGVLFLAVPFFAVVRGSRGADGSAAGEGDG